MSFKLFCNKNPIALGIKDVSGAWDLSKFEAHIKKCKVCGRAKRALKSEVQPIFRHGGRRKGSGRPALGVKRVNVMLADRQIAKATRIGEGNLSRGVRKVIDDSATPPGEASP